MIFLIKSLKSPEAWSCTLEQAREFCHSVGDEIDLPDCIARGFECDVYKHGIPAFRLSRWQ